MKTATLLSTLAFTLCVLGNVAVAQTAATTPADPVATPRMESGAPAGNLSTQEADRLKARQARMAAAAADHKAMAKTDDAKPKHVKAGHKKAKHAAKHKKHSKARAMPAAFAPAAR